MTLELSLKEFSIPFKNPLHVNKATLNFRRYILITLTSPEGLTSASEIAPLPGLHQESLSEAADQLHRIKPYLQNADFTSATTIESFVENINETIRLYPSVRCGLEMALFLLLAKRNNLPLSKLLNPTALDALPINALLRNNLNKNELALILRKWKAEKRTSVKIKLGRQTLKDDIAMINSILSTLSTTTTLRLDINQRWTAAELHTFISSVDQTRIEYIEEPLTDYRDIQSIPDIQSTRIALDESLVGLDPSLFIFPPYIKAFVIKPMVIGGIIPTLRLADLAKKNGRYCVISSTYESPSGLDNLKQLALALHKPGVAAGLDTREAFDL